MNRRELLVSTILASSGLSWAQAPAETARRVRAQPAPPGSGQKLAFGLITPRNAEQTLKNWNPFIERMAQAAGVAIESRTYASVAELVADFIGGRLDLAWLGNVPALEIVESGKGSVFAVKVIQGKTAYRSLLITHRDSAIRTLDDVHRNAPQLVFGDGDPKSTSGHIVPMYFAFVKRGINEPEKLFKEIRRASHEGNLLAAARKEVDLATNNSTELENLRTANPEQAGLLRVVWESPDIPESPLVWRDTLPIALKQKIAAFTERFGSASDEEKGILWNIDKMSGFRRSSNRQLVTVADIEMFNARQRIINDSTLSQAERLVRVDEVTRRGSKLELLLKRSG